MKTIRIILWIIVLPALVLTGCNKDEGGDAAASGITGEWIWTEVDGNAVYNYTDLTTVVNAQFPLDMTDDESIWKFESNGKCNLDGDKADYTYTGNKLEIDDGATYTVTISGNKMDLKADKNTSKEFATMIARQAIPNICYGCTWENQQASVTSASFTFTFERKSGSSGGGSGGGGIFD